MAVERQSSFEVAVHWMMFSKEAEFLATKKCRASGATWAHDRTLPSFLCAGRSPAWPRMECGGQVSMTSLALQQLPKVFPEAFPSGAMIFVAMNPKTGHC